MEILLKSIGGGLAVAVFLTVSKLFGEKTAGLISAFPVLFVISFVLITYNTNTEVTKNFILGGIFSAISFVFFVTTLYFLHLKHPGIYWKHLLLAYVLWFCITFFWMFIIKK